MKTAYVSGPMRGRELFGFPQFDKAAARLRRDGWRVLSPAEHDRETGFDETQDSLDGFDLASAFRWDVEAILQADAIYMLRGWETSVGAGLEHRIATMIGLDVMYERGAVRAEMVA